MKAKKLIFHPGYSDDPRRLNVLLTRARIGLVVVGHRKTLESSPLWQRWLDQAPTLPLTEVENIKKGPSNKSSRGGSSGHPPKDPPRGRPKGPSGGTERGPPGQGNKETKRRAPKANGKYSSRSQGAGIVKECTQKASTVDPSTSPSQGKHSPGEMFGMERLSLDGLDQVEKVRKCSIYL